jgi:hypothetical protein
VFLADGTPQEVKDKADADSVEQAFLAIVEAAS